MHNLANSERAGTKMMEQSLAVEFTPQPLFGPQFVPESNLTSGWGPRSPVSLLPKHTLPVRGSLPPSFNETFEDCAPKIGQKAQAGFYYGLMQFNCIKEVPASKAVFIRPGSGSLSPNLRSDLDSFLQRHSPRLSSSQFLDCSHARLFSPSKLLREEMLPYLEKFAGRVVVGANFRTTDDDMAKRREELFTGGVGETAQAAALRQYFEKYAGRAQAEKYAGRAEAAANRQAAVKRQQSLVLAMAKTAGQNIDGARRLDGANDADSEFDAVDDRRRLFFSFIAPTSLLVGKWDVLGRLSKKRLRRIETASGSSGQNFLGWRRLGPA